MDWRLDRGVFMNVHVQVWLRVESTCLQRNMWAGSCKEIVIAYTVLLELAQCIIGDKGRNLNGIDKPQKL